MLHTTHQQVVFYTYLNKTLNNPHLTLGIRSMLNGAEINVKRSLEFVPKADLDEKDCYTFLWVYRKLIPIKNKYIDNVLDDVHLDPSKEDLWGYRYELNVIFDMLGLPNLTT